ncbi:hypothetical protein [Actinoplanes sp. NPDC026619]|uniref:hypothetical protein n=1 Tax=Actinoplanes sp. NPDC026619 TaxID=3155798 RepID=UPI0033E26C3A
MAFSADDFIGRAIVLNCELHDRAFRELRLGHLDLARELFARGRQQVFSNGWDGFVPFVCVAGAALAAAEADHRRAARLIGVADAAFTALGQMPDPNDDAELAAARRGAIGALGPAGFAAEYAHGRALDPRTAFGA